MATVNLTTNEHPTEKSDIITVEVGDTTEYWVMPGLGDDAVTLGDGGGTVSYGGSLYYKNWVTGETTLAYEITKDADGVVTVVDTNLADGDEGTDTLINVDRLWFGDQSEVRLDTNYWAWAWDRSEWVWDSESQTNTEYRFDMRVVRAEGSAFDDVIIGQQGSDSLEGRAGNDIILADGDATAAETRLNFTGGDVWNMPHLTEGVVQTNLTFNPVDASLSPFGVALMNSSGGIDWRNIDTLASAELVVNMAAVDSSGVSQDLTSYSTDSLANINDILAYKADLESQGGEVQLWVDATLNDGQSYRVLLGIEDASNLWSDDEVRGGAGNDFIDGGLVAAAPTGFFSWRGNEARYEGERDDYVIEQVKVTSATNLAAVTGFVSGKSFNEFLAELDGKTVEEYLADVGETGSVSNLEELLALLGIATSYTQDTIEHGLLDDGVTYTLIGDTVQGRDGVDLLENINNLSFSDGSWNLTVDIQEKTWSSLYGLDAQGSIVNDLIDTTANGGFDSVDAKSGNDFILTGTGGDWVRAGSGNDFADGGATGSGADNWWENRDQFVLSGARTRYTVEIATESQVNAFIQDNFADQVYTYDPALNYYLVTDLSPFGGDGQDLITNFDVLEFSDLSLSLAPDISQYVDGWFNFIQTDINGSAFADEIYAADLLADTIYVEYTQSQVAQGTVTSEFIEKLWANLNDGDDVYFGTENGDRVFLGAGNDLFVGGGSTFYANDSWLGSDEVGFEGQFERFEIIEVKAGESRTIDGVEVDLTNLAQGTVSFNGKLHDVGAHASGYVVRDLLPEALGGLGVDLILDANAITFNGSYIRLNTEIHRFEPAEWMDGSPLRANLSFGYLGGVEDYSAGLEAIDDAGNIVTVVHGHINTSAGNDSVIGFEGNNYFDLQKGGNDFISAPGSFGESGVNPWDYRDTVRVSGTEDQFSIRQVYIELDADGYALRDIDGDVSYWTQASVERVQAIEVVDLRPDGGASYLLGIEQIDFAESSIQVGLSYRENEENLSFTDSFTAAHVLPSRDIQAGLVALEVNGSPFADTIVGRDAPDYSALADNYFAVDLSSDLFMLIVNAAEGGASALVTFRDSNGDGQIDPVGTLAEEDLSQVTGKIWVDTAEHAVSLQAKVDSFDPVGKSFADLLAVVETEIDSWGPIDDAWSEDRQFVQDILTVGYVGNTDMVVPIAINSLNLPQTRVDLGSDRLFGGDGDDLLFGMGGDDKFFGRAGNDLLDGGVESAVATFGENSWDGDRAIYDGVSSQYLVSEIYVLRDSSGRVIAESSVAVDGYERAVVVQDTISDNLGGSGRDILIDIEQISFDGDNGQLRIDDIAGIQLGNWLPGIGNSKFTGQLATQLEVWNRSAFGSEIDAASLWSEVSGYPSVVLTDDISGSSVEIAGFVKVNASRGDDTFIGISNLDPSSNEIVFDRYELTNASLSNYTLSQEIDESGVRYVHLQVKSGFESDYSLNTAKLYDVDTLWNEAEQINLVLTPYEQWNRFDEGMGSTLYGSIFDDVLTEEMIASTFDENHAPFTYVWANKGNDTVYAGEGHTVYYEFNGDDFVDGGEGIDLAITTTDISSLDVGYFFDANGNRQLDEGEELTLSEFQQDGVAGIYSISTGQNGRTVDASTAIDFVTYETSHSAVNLIQESATIAAEKGLLDTGAGWFSYNDGYYVYLNDTSGAGVDGAGNGLDIYKNIEAVLVENTLVDLLTGLAYVEDGWVYGLQDKDLVIDLDPSGVALDTLTYSGVPEIPVGQSIEFHFETDFENPLVELSDGFSDYGGSLGVSIFPNFFDEAGDSTYYGVDGAITIAPATALATAYLGADNFPEQYKTAIQDGQTITVSTNEWFKDSYGDDIYVGNGTGNYLLGDMSVAYPSHRLDGLTLTGSKERVEIVYGRLNADGRVDSSHTDNQRLLDFVGEAYTPYFITRDALSPELGGGGENLGVGIGRIEFSDFTNIRVDTIQGLRSISDSENKLQVQMAVNSGDFNPYEDAGLRQALENGDYRSVEVNDSEGGAHYVGIAELVFIDQWDYLDKVKLNSLSTDQFDISKVYVAQNSQTGALERDFAGKTVLYEAPESVTAGYIAKVAMLLDGKTDEVGDKVLVNMEKVELANSTLNASTNYQTETAGDGWSEKIVRDDGTEGFIEGFTRLRIKLADYGDTINLSADEATALFEQATLANNNIELSVVDVDDGQGSDVIIVNTSNFGERVNLKNGGDDFVMFTNRDDLADFELVWRDHQVSFRSASSRFDIEEVYVQLNSDGTPLTRSNGSIIFVSSADEGAVKAIRVADKLSSANDAYLGEKVIVGAERLWFDGDRTEIRLQGDSNTWDSDGDGIPDEFSQWGTNISETLSYSEDNTADARDFIDGQGGDDILIGGGGGDELRGGTGNDILIGGANGTTGDHWFDQDRAQYWDLDKSDLEVESITIGFNEAANEVLRDALGEVIIGAEIADLKTGFVLTDAVQVTDLTGTYGTDILIGVEVINTKTGDVAGSTRVEYNDWDQDGTVDQVYIQGTDFDDVIGSPSFAAEELKYENGIDLGAGDDVVYAGVGGDWIRPGSGTDLIIGGANGQLNEWGWVPTDSAQFSGNYDRYTLKNVTFELGTALDITNAAGEVMFSVDAQGRLVKADAPNNLLYTVKEGQLLTSVEDSIPDLEFLDGDGFNLLIGVEGVNFQDRWISTAVERNISRDADGNAEYGWMRGTQGDDLILGSEANDYINGADGNDTLVGLAGNDDFEAGTGDDIIYGDKRSLDSNVSIKLSGNDNVRYRGDYDQFVITKKVGEVEGVLRSYVEVKDLLPAEFGGSGTDILVGIESLSFDDQWINIGIQSWDQFDNEGNLISIHYRGSDFADSISGSSYGDMFWDGAGDDVIYGFSGADYFEIGYGDDTVYGGEEGLRPWGGQGVDEARFVGDYSNYTVTFYDENGQDTGGSYAASGYIVVEDTRATGFGKNTLYGVESLSFDNKWINLEGYANGTNIVGTESGDTLNASANWGESVDYRIDGGAGDDILYGYAGNDLLEGGDGSDILYGSFNSTSRDADVAVYDYSRSSLTVEAITDGYSVTIGSDIDELYGIEQIRTVDMTLNLVENYLVRDFDKDGVFETALFSGLFSGTVEAILGSFDSDFRNELDALGVDANKLSNVLDYRLNLGEGNDRVTLGSGNDFVNWSEGVDSIDGGEGTDTFVIDDTWNPSKWGLSSVSDLEHTIEYGSSSTTLYNFDIVRFSDRDVALKDVMELEDIDGDGTPDIGRFVNAWTNNWEEEIFDASASEYSSISWTITGSDGDDKFTGGLLDDVFIGNGGNDGFIGGGGFDTAVFEGERSQYIVELQNEFGEWKVAELIDGVASEVWTMVADIDALRFTDGLFRLNPTSELVDEFVFGVGRVQTQLVRGTTFGETLDATVAGVNVSVSGGIDNNNGNYDTFVVDLAELQETRILDFEAPTSDVATRDVLKFIASADSGLTVDDILAAADGSSNQDAVTFNFSGNELILEGTALADLSDLNVSLELV